MPTNLLTRIRDMVSGKKAEQAASSKGGAEGKQEFGDVAATEVLTEERGIEGQSLFQGRVFVLDLEPFFEAIGSTTSRTAQNLVFMCDNVLTKRLGPGGAHSLYDDQVFMFRFEDENDPNGWRHAMEIVNEIGINFFGESFKPEELMEEVIAEVEAKEVVDAVGEVNVDLVKQIVIPDYDDRIAEDPEWDFRSETIEEKDPEWVPMHEVAEEEEAKIVYDRIERSQPQVDRAWEVQKHKKRTTAMRVERGPDRRKGAPAMGYAGPERRREKPNGRRASDDPKVNVW